MKESYNIILGGTIFNTTDFDFWAIFKSKKLANFKTEISILLSHQVFFFNVLNVKIFNFFLNKQLMLIWRLYAEPDMSHGKEKGSELFRKEERASEQQENNLLAKGAKIS